MSYQVTAVFTVDAPSRAEAAETVAEYLTLAAGWVEREAIHQVTVVNDTDAPEKAVKLAERIAYEVERVRDMAGYREDGADVWLGTSLHAIEDAARAITTPTPEA